jgi:hypothetical protein
MYSNIFLFIFFLFAHAANAALSPSFLKMTLSSEAMQYSKGTSFTFQVTFSNEDDGRRSIVLPGDEKKGLKLIYLSFFTVKGDQYTEVYREEREIKMDTNIVGTSSFRYLNAKENISVPLIFNDVKNYSNHIHSNHIFPDLPIGEYQVLAWYNPWDDFFSEYAFNKMDLKGNVAEQIRDSTRFDLSESGIHSNYLSLTITENPLAKLSWTPTDFCPLDCEMCGAIDENDWNKVSKMINHQTAYKHKNDTGKLDSIWRMKHRGVLWLGPDPQAILASLPTWTGRKIIFKNEEDYHYFYLSWQIGEVYTARSRFSSIFYWMGFRKAPFSTAEVDCLKLVGMLPL